MLGAVALVLGACGADDEDGEAAGVDEPAEEPGGSDEEPTGAGDADEFPDTSSAVTETSVRIGIHAPLRLGTLDIDSVLGFGRLSQLFWDDINAGGGINGRQVQVELANDGYAVDSALQACRDLVQKDVLFVSGTGGADQIAACGQYSLSQKVPYMSLGVSEAGLVDKAGYRALTITYDRASRLLAQYMVNELGGDEKPMAMLRMNTPNLDGAHQAFLDELEELGESLVVDDAVDKQANVEQLTSECLKLKQADAQLVYVNAAPTVSGALIRSCASQGYKPMLVTVPNTFACTAEPPLGAPEMEGCHGMLSSQNPDDLGDSELAKKAVTLWEAKFPDAEFPSEGALLWGFFDVIREALELAGDDLSPRSFLQALDDLEYDNGIFNPVAFKGEKVNTTGVLVVKGTPSGYETVVGDWTDEF